MNPSPAPVDASVADAAAPAAGAAAPLHPLLERLGRDAGCPPLDDAGYDAWANAPGRALVFFSEDPAQYRETLDLAVIVPELARAFAGRFRSAWLPPASARRLAPRYGFRRWPALVMLDAGRYVGAVDGLRDWSDYLDALAQLLEAPVARAPGIGIAVKADGADDAPACR